MEANALSQMGNPEEVATAAVTAYRRRSFLGRHTMATFCVFGLSPIVMLILLVALWAAGSTWGTYEACKAMGINAERSLRNLKRLDSTDSVTPYVLSLLFVVIPSIATAVFYGKLARRLALGRKWIAVSCVVLALVVLPVFCSAKFSDVPGQSSFGVGYCLSTDIVRSYCHSPQLLQFLIPLAIGCWFMWRRADQVRLPSAA